MVVQPEPAHRTVAFAQQGFESLDNALTAEAILQAPDLEENLPLCSSSIPSRATKTVFQSIERADKDEYGAYHGPECKVTTTEKVEFCGRMHHGYMHGKCKLKYPNGVCFHGFMQFNQITGLGVLQWKYAKYYGHLLNGRPHGDGTLILLGDNNVIYRGEFNHGIRHGRGNLRLNHEETHMYEGEWHWDQKHGWGVMRYASGDEYEGEWRHDFKEGFGTMYWKGSQERYRGQWRHSLQNGVGEHTWYAGDKPELPSHALFLRFNRYVGMMQSGHRHGEGTMLYSTGARYEGQWRCDAKEGEGIYVFEDGSTWLGQWKNDQPVCDQTPFQPAGTGPCLYIEDLLKEHACTPSMGQRMCLGLLEKHSELRRLYDIYSAKQLPWLDSGRYTQAQELRPAFGLLSMQFWQLMRDARILDPAYSLSAVASAMGLACRPEPCINERRSRVSQTRDAPGVWTFNLPDLSPFQELNYRQFCETIVRVAIAAFSHISGLDERTRVMISAHLVPLQYQAPMDALQELLDSASFVQYFQNIDAVMRVVFAATARKMQVNNASADSYVDEDATYPNAKPQSLLQFAQRGLFLVPDLTNTGMAISDAPDDGKTHPLDVVPKDENDRCTLPVNRLMALLICSGMVSTHINPKPVTCSQVMQAIVEACFPSREVVDQQVPQQAENSNSRGLAHCATLSLTYYEFILACVGIAQFRTFIDGPRGLMAEALRKTQSDLPLGLATAFSYFNQKGPGSTRRSRHSAVGSRSSVNSVASLGSKLAGVQEVADEGADVLLSGASQG